MFQTLIVLLQSGNVSHKNKLKQSTQRFQTLIVLLQSGNPKVDTKYEPINIFRFKPLSYYYSQGINDWIWSSKSNGILFQTLIVLLQSGNLKKVILGVRLQMKVSNPYRITTVREF